MTIWVLGYLSQPNCKSFYGGEYQTVIKQTLQVGVRKGHVADRAEEMFSQQRWEGALVGIRK